MPRILLSILVLILAQHATAAQPAAKKTAPAAKIVVVQPQADQQVTGTVDVRIKVELPEGATAPTVVYVGLGGAPWTGLKQDGGEWAAQIDTTLVPNGAQKLIFTTDNKRANTSVNVTVDVADAGDAGLHRIHQRLAGPRLDAQAVGGIWGRVNDHRER